MAESIISKLNEKNIKNEMSTIAFSCKKIQKLRAES